MMYICADARSLESSSSSTTVTPLASSNNGSWEEVRVNCVKKKNIKHSQQLSRTVELYFLL